VTPLFAPILAKDGFGRAIEKIVPPRRGRSQRKRIVVGNGPALALRILNCAQILSGEIASRIRAKQFEVRVGVHAVLRPAG